MSFTPPGATQQTDSKHRLNIGAMFLFVAGVAITWVALYYFNAWIFSDIHITGFISWIFLPAAIRMLAVMVGGWAGALGLFVGAMFTNFNFLAQEPVNMVMLAALSALGPVVAVHLCTKLFRLPADFLGLHRAQLLVFAVMGAVFNAVPHNFFFYATGLTNNAWSGIFPMFVGDLVGTLIVLYFASFSIRLLGKARGT